MMQRAVFEMEWAWEYDVAAMAKEGVVYPGNSSTNAQGLAHADDNPNNDTNHNDT